MDIKIEVLQQCINESAFILLPYALPPSKFASQQAMTTDCNMALFMCWKIMFKYYTYGERKTYVDFIVMQRSCSSFLVSVKRVSPALALAIIPALDTRESVSVDFP
jgi:hypothetical protein